MKISIPKERSPYETRVAATPETVKKLVGRGFTVMVESGAGSAASFTDEAYQASGAKIAKQTQDVYKDAAIVLKVQRPMGKGKDMLDERALLEKGSVLVSLLSPYTAAEDVAYYQKKSITSFAMELIPRITRAQSMDVLSSQTNLAGYRAVLEAVAVFGRALPMMMTAAGTLLPAKVLVLGAGVAGLQAIATARRLGAVVSAFDVRPAVKEQVESLGATFIQVDAKAEDAETAGGYAKEMGADYKKRQTQLIHETLKKTDIAISTALIPGKPAPTLITEPMVRDMPEGAVIVDLAVENGGNCTLSKVGEIVESHGVKIIGFPNLPARLAEDSSSFYGKNILNFLDLLIDKKKNELAIDWEDEIIKGAAVTHNGNILKEEIMGSSGGHKASGKKPTEKSASKSAPKSIAKKRAKVKK
ncbi:MAG: Re/Si-specific NAD(P)(+) transhydrogenase subunit alpha [Alphaproteobacteria bacterium]|jgi:H+-translocating NAD(P) transhydrogenase subunit alpha|nr:Re/Si-specific NAD(P)(+) transhydrogenase subunit alpha [Alphaproteobacteria bacterium]MBT5389208.1 Re/Si-specific NAD(P)(+) transhydrogenase subunit alpha [Alphaproteobacteria bacterium]MBT5540908.1 Re/Si-specific NAD(P)(+) transhydrogenase subunit alpha [Alphaproteobacteria bacterium]MBT5654822.1 Re/Si-specific NAD(P)(+) transhydrogenase subunit alpha [Alphaproteobacteria bacterium]